MCKLKRNLYGLKQAPRKWYLKFGKFMSENGYKRCHADYYCYHKTFDDEYIILPLYVDDMLVAGSSIHEIDNLKKQLSKEFKMDDLGAVKQIIGTRITRNRKNHELRFSQAEYVEKVLSRFNMKDAKPVNTPLVSSFRLYNENSPKIEKEKDYMSRVPYTLAMNSLIYTMVSTRLVIAQTVQVVIRFMN